MTNFGTEIESLLSTDRILNLIQYSNAAPNDGYILEVGIYKGGSLEILAKYNTCDIIAIDSFEGVSQETEHDFHRLGDFGGVDFHAIAGYFKIKHQTVRIVKGFIPKAFDFFNNDVRFRFSHIDLDMYDSVKSACEFIYSHTVDGGIMLFDDYNVRSTPGATKAIDEFAATITPKFKGELKLMNGQTHYQYLIIK